MSEAALRIRPMEARDGAAVARLSGELGYPVTAESVAVRLRALSGRAGDALFVGESDAGEVLGWIHISEDTTVIAGPIAEIRALVVDARFRSKGIGKRLVAEAERWAATRGYPRVRVRSRIAREDAHRFYATGGYTVEKTQHVFSKPITGN